jgi:hypothetical protein
MNLLHGEEMEFNFWSQYKYKSTYLH